MYYQIHQSGPGNLSRMKTKFRDQMVCAFYPTGQTEIKYTVLNTLRELTGRIEGLTLNYAFDQDAREVHIFFENTRQKAILSINHVSNPDDEIKERLKTINKLINQLNGE